MKRRAQDKLLSDTNPQLTDVDHLVLDILESSTVIKKEPKEYLQTVLDQQANSSNDSGLELPMSPKVKVKTGKSVKKQAESSHDSGLGLPISPIVKAMKEQIVPKQFAECLKCDRSFTMKSSLLRHNKRRHNEEILNPNEVAADPENALTDDFNLNMFLDGHEYRTNIENDNTNGISNLLEELEILLSDFPPAPDKSKPQQTKPKSDSLPIKDKIQTEPYFQVENASNESKDEKRKQPENLKRTSFEAQQADLDLETCLSVSDIKNKNASSKISENKKSDFLNKHPESASNKSETNIDFPNEFNVTSESKLNIQKDAKVQLPENYLNPPNDNVHFLEKELIQKEPNEKHGNLNIATPIKFEPGTVLQEASPKADPKSNLGQIPHKVSNGRFICQIGECKIDGKSFQWPKSLKEHFQRQHQGN